MKIKQRIDDFRVRELLEPEFVRERGEYRVYRVTKRRLTSLEAASELAYAAGVPAGEVALAGLKDRQGVTVQHMTIRRGRDVSLRAQDLSVESIGFAADALTSERSLGNAFEVTLRGLVQEELDVLRDNLAVLRECGVVNYFDEQRFGNLRHNQGWIAQQLMRGEHGPALQRLLASLSDHDDAGAHAFKRALLDAWGDWGRCREIAGRFGKHHSVFEHLKRNDGDFAGAFFHVSSRLRLIHLYSFQSHLWNRAVAELVQSRVPAEQRVVLGGLEGPLTYPVKPLGFAPGATFRLPGPGLEDVEDPVQRRLLEDALARERMVAADFRIEGVPGFQLKGEDRELVIEPRHLRVRPPERDKYNFGAHAVKVRFELPRGAYATLVVRRLLSTPQRTAARERGFERNISGERRGRELPQHRESGRSLAPPEREHGWRERPFDARDSERRGRRGPPGAFPPPPDPRGPGRVWRPKRPPHGGEPRSGGEHRGGDRGGGTQR